MAYERREGDGVLWKNDRKTPGSKQPDYRGDALVGGKECWVSGWIKTKGNGEKFLSLSIEHKDAKREMGGSRPADEDFSDIDESSVPF